MEISQVHPMIKTIVIAMLLLSISIVSAAAKDKKKVEPQKVAAENLQPHILDKFTSCKDVKAAGISNVPVPPGYTPLGWRRSADADNDGVACEKK
jgi:Excalibur calcium-binding domain